MSDSKGKEYPETPPSLATPPRSVSMLKESSIKRSKTSLNFIDCVKPIFDSSKKFGLMTFTIIFATNGEAEKINVNFKDILWFITSVLISLTTGMLSILYLVPMDSDDIHTTILIRSRNLLLTAAVFLCTISAMTNMINRQHFIDIVKMITECDKKVENKFIYFFAKL